VVPPCSSLTAIVKTLTALVVGAGIQEQQQAEAEAEAEAEAAAGGASSGDGHGHRKRTAVASKLGKLRTVLAVKPTSKLLLKVLAAEMKRATPFLHGGNSSSTSADNVKRGSPVAQLLSTMTAFFTSLQVNFQHSENELLFMCGKTLLLEMTRALGGRKILNLLDFLGVSPGNKGASLILSLTRRFDPSCAADLNLSPQQQQQQQGGNENMNLGNALATRTSASDTSSPTKTGVSSSSSSSSAAAAAAAAAVPLSGGLAEIKAHMKRLSLASSKLGDGSDAPPALASASLSEAGMATFPVVSKTTSELQERVNRLKRHILEKE
jgi:hypothetical protein